MALAVCFNCGRQKDEAWNACGVCGIAPRSEDDLALSLALTDANYLRLTLFHFGRKISQGLRPKLPPETHERFLRIVRESKRKETDPPTKVAEPEEERPDMRFAWDLESGESTPQITPLGVFQIAAGFAGTVLATAAGYANHHLEMIRLGDEEAIDLPFWKELGDWTWWPAWACWMIASAVVPMIGFFWPRYVGSVRLFVALGCAIAVLVPVAYFIPVWL